ncbi:LysR family transcriptional regulator [Paraburkholderia sediminicola]|uniref:LysR family transcriptional regulator n=1 Tax=Paraburkholderia sediminicola TaxID=458836 RepID=UPI0038BD67FD
MDLKALRYFTEIVRHGSFARASEAIPLSQPALSRSVRTLGEELGESLLERGAAASVCA